MTGPPALGDDAAARRDDLVQVPHQQPGALPAGEAQEEAEGAAHGSNDRAGGRKIETLLKEATTTADPSPSIT